MLKYLIKFLNNKYLDYFLNNGLYMNSVDYFTHLKDTSNQGDKYEGLAIAPPQKYNNFSKNRTKPIWCCVSVDESDITCGIFKIDSRVIKDFCNNSIEDGVIAIIDYEKFISMLHEYKDEYEMIYGSVNYIDLKAKSFDLFMSKYWYDVLFIKDSRFSYQKEFRLAICRNCVAAEKEVTLYHIKTTIIDSYLPYEYKLPNLKKISKILQLKDIIQDSQYLYIEL